MAFDAEVAAGLRSCSAVCFQLLRNIRTWNHATTTRGRR